MGGGEIPQQTLSKVMSFSCCVENVLWTWVSGCWSISTHISFSREQTEEEKLEGWDEKDKEGRPIKTSLQEARESGEEK